MGAKVDGGGLLCGRTDTAVSVDGFYNGLIVSILVPFMMFFEKKTLPYWKIYVFLHLGIKVEILTLKYSK
jgi:hypothetical protein